MNTSIHGKRLSRLLSLYIDEQLAQDERIEIEALLEGSDDARREYETLLRVKRLLAGTPPLHTNPFLVEKILNKATAAKNDPVEAGFLPKRFVPAAAMLAVAIVIFGGTFAVFKYDDIASYLNQKSTAVKHAYEENVLVGWIMPLFERTDDDEVLNYAMFGVLPLDADQGTVLRIDKNSEEGYKVELASGDTAAARAVTVADLYLEIRPTASQKKVFDTLFLYARKHIEEAVLINEKKELAIDPSIARFHKVILAGIAANLEPRQLERFERFMEERQTTYALASHAPAPPAPPAVIYARLKHERERCEFVVLTADEVNMQTMRLDMDSLRDLMLLAKRQNRQFEYRIHALAKQLFASRHGTLRLPDREGTAVSGEVSISENTSPVPSLSSRPVVIRNDDGSITISIARDIEAVERTYERASDTFFRHVIVMRQRQSDRNVQQFGTAGETGGVPGIRSSVQVTLSSDTAEEILIEIDERFEERLDVDIIRRLEMYLPPQGDAQPGRYLFQWNEYMPAKARRMLDSLKELEQKELDQHDFDLQEQDERRVHELLEQRQATDSAAVR